ncbi:MAG: hypothetical protein WA749_12180 [Gelidibacter sp.]
MTAMLNKSGGFYRVKHSLQESHKQGDTICSPCINNREHLNRLIDTSIYLGFGHLKNLESYTAVFSKRQWPGLYKSLDDFIYRIKISIEQLTILTRIGAFRFTKHSKTELLSQAIFKLNASQSCLKSKIRNSSSQN